LHDTVTSVARLSPLRFATAHQGAALPPSLAGVKADTVFLLPATYVPGAGQLRSFRLLLLSATFLIGIFGCGSGSSIKAGYISVTDPNGVVAGQLTSLGITNAAEVSMTPVGDKANAGVDWAVTCGGSPVTGSITGGACGTLAPTHTPNGVASIYTAPSIVPLGTTVTITAAATSSPSAYSSVTLPIVSLPISISFLSAPLTVAMGGTADFSVSVVNGTTGAGVKWTAACGASACGSFNPSIGGQSTIYTAPSAMPSGCVLTSSGCNVTITATSIDDPSVSASTTLTILNVFVSITPASYYVATSGAASFTATLTNDVLPKGADWSLSCGTPGNCGTFNGSTATVAHSSSGVAVKYSAPSTIPSGGGTVTITATSTIEPTQSYSATITITAATPILVTMTTQPSATSAAGAQVTLTATVANDPNNLGVNWTASCGSAVAGACGTFGSASTSGSGASTAYSITYIAPSTVPADGGVVTITASSAATTPANPAIATTIVMLTPAITFLQLPPSSLTAGTQTLVSATITNDSSSGGVTWTVQCNSSVAGGCGAIVPYQTASGQTATYTAPPVTTTGTTVTIKATSTAASGVNVSSSGIAITPATAFSITFVPFAPTQLQVASTVNLVAAVSHDSTQAGVDWEVCASGCGFFTIKPAVPEILATTTTPYVPAQLAVIATTATAWPNGLPIPYTAPNEPPSSGFVPVVATAHADGKTATVATVAITSVGTGSALNGTVLAGAQPVVGATVQLYAAGTSGYGSVASALSSPSSTAAVTTDDNGNFRIQAGYACPKSNSQIYVVASGGRVGTNAPNSDLAMMTALGPCSNLSSQSIVVNEVTTVASVWPLAPFAANDVLTGNSSYLYLGTSSSNVAGLANAFATVNNLVDVYTGQPRFTVPVDNASVPYVEINTLADVLNICTATGGGSEGDGSGCGTLLSATDAISNHSFYNSTAPTDTLQAAFNIAQHPGGNGGFGYVVYVTDYVLPLVSLKSPFQPILTASPNDWALSLNFTGGGGLSSSSSAQYFAIDASDNLWITDSNAGSVIEWNNRGAALSPSSGFLAGGGPIAIDATGNIWVSGTNLVELSSLGTALPWSPFSGGVGGSDMAIDALGNLWIPNGNSVVEFNSLGAEISPINGTVNGYVNSGISGIGPLALDSSNNVWAGYLLSGPRYGLAELSNVSGQLIADTLGLGTGGPVESQIAADGSGNIWTPLPGIGGLCKMPPYSGIGATLQGSCYIGGTGAVVQSIYNPRGIAIDGAGTVWVANLGGVDVSPNLTEVIPADLSAGYYANFQSSSLSVGPLRVAVDGSGNVWVLLANNTVTEYVGIATPAVTPIALAVKSKKLGAKP